MDANVMKNIVAVLTSVLVLVTVLFLLSILKPGFNRWIARRIRRTFLGRLVRPEHSIWELLMWSRKSADAMLQITKTYDWRVQQWSGFSTAVLTATLAFISAVVLEYFKNTITSNLRLKLWLTLLGVLASFVVYLISQKRITLLKNQFLGLYSLLRRLSGV